MCREIGTGVPSDGNENITKNDGDRVKVRRMRKICFHEKDLIAKGLEHRTGPGLRALVVERQAQRQPPSRMMTRARQAHQKTKPRNISKGTMTLARSDDNTQEEEE